MGAPIYFISRKTRPERQIILKVLNSARLAESRDIYNTPPKAVGPLKTTIITKKA